jgi:hypothetical protein
VLRAQGQALRVCASRLEAQTNAPALALVLRDLARLGGARQRGLAPRELERGELEQERVARVRRARGGVELAHEPAQAPVLAVHHPALHDRVWRASVRPAGARARHETDRAFVLEREHPSRCGRHE